jgi:two-component system cell cycle response regulator DivK
VRFEESEQTCKQNGITRLRAKLIRPDSGQVQEPPGPAFVSERYSQRCKREGLWVIWCLRAHHLDTLLNRGNDLAKILIVEDNALNIKLFCDLLEAHGHQPEAVTDSRNALDVAREFSPDLVITDIQLPHVSGLDLIRLLRADDQLANVPIMAVTAYAARGDEERIRAAGAQAYVSKPISVVKFAETVEQLLPKPEPATQM